MSMSTALRGLSDLTEGSMARHLTKVLRGGSACYSPGMGWMLWDGCRWQRDSDREALKVQGEILRYIRDWITTEITLLPTWAVAALHRYITLNGLIRLERMMRREEFVAVTAERFDSIPNLLNTPTGVLDLITGTVEPHDPRLYITKITGASYVPGSTHDDWTQALKALPDDETRKWLQAYLGRGLTGGQSGAEFVPFLIGGGSNGKSLIIGAVMRALGDYGGIVADELLAGKVHESHTTRLRGMRLAVVEELGDGHRLNVARLKQITGTDKMVGRYLFQEPIEWEPTHTLCVTSNFMPLVPETDWGTWRRLKAVPFPNEYKADPALKERLFTGVEQQQAVMSWLVEGAMMDIPPASAEMEKATTEWRMSVDLVAQFLDECCVKDPKGEETRQIVLDRFNDFAESQGNRKLTGRVFTERFRSHQIVKEWGIADIRRSDGRYWTGFKLITPHVHAEGK